MEFAVSITSCYKAISSVSIILIYSFLSYFYISEILTYLYWNKYTCIHWWCSWRTRTKKTKLHRRQKKTPRIGKNVIFPYLHLVCFWISSLNWLSVWQLERQFLLLAHMTEDRGTGKKDNLKLDLFKLAWPQTLRKYVGILAEPNGSY